MNNWTAGLGCWHLLNYHRQKEVTLRTLWIVGVALLVACAAPLSAQQLSPPKGMEINLPEVVAEVTASWTAYFQALNSGNIAVQNATFRSDERTVRYGAAENLYGYKAIEGYRTTARPFDPPLTFSNTVITTYGRDFAVASTLTHRANQPGKVGRTMQTWVRFPDGWKVVAAHVSNIDEPK
jgi:Protein of unknown function (DUF3225)